MKKLLSYASMFFFASWLIYQSATMLEEVWLFLTLLAGGSLLVIATIKYFLNKQRW